MNRTGWRQCRVHLGAATDGDSFTDAIGFCPGEYADAAVRPRLVVTYH